MGNKNEILEQYIERVYSDTSIYPELMTAEERKLITETYKDKGRVLCVPSPYSLEESISTELSILEDHNVINYTSFNVETAKSTSTYFNKISERLITSNNVIPLIPSPFSKYKFLVSSVPREEAEYNPKLWQLVVCGVVLCKDGIVLLQNNDKHPRIPNKITLIQGHVDGKKEMHMMTANEFFAKEFVRELVEELKFPVVDEDRLADHTNMVSTVQMNIDPVSMDHFGIFCITDLRGFELSASDITSNEDSHNPVVFKNAKEILSDKNIDSWVGLVSIYLDLEVEEL